jgi:uncharacterized delta-60 repeat protein
VRRAATAIALAALLLGATVALAAPGDLDPTFDGDGIATIDFGGSDRAQEVLAQADGKLVVAGRGAPGDGDFAVGRLNLNGSPDDTFGSAGKTLVDLGAADGDRAEAAALQPDGRIVLAGVAHPGGADNNLGFARVTANGSLDASFDGDGRRVIDYGGDDQAVDVVLQPDGKIVAAGTIFGGEFLVVRLNPDGSSDTTFSGGGAASVNFGGDDDGSAVALQGDGKIVVAGRTSSPGGSDVAVARLNADSSLDTTFDADGRRTLDLGNVDSAADVLLQPDGKIVVVGATGFPATHATVTRLNPNGSLDTSFDGDGTVRVDTGADDQAVAVALQANGKIVVAGSKAGSPLLLRLQPGGALDTTFGSGGQRTLPVSGSANAVTLRSGGRIAAAGSSLGNALVALFEGDSPAAGGGPVTGPGGGPGGGSGGGGGTFKVPRCAGKKATIVGTEKANRLKGTRRADVIVGLGGNDKIDGARGNDLICAGTGNDTVKGSSGNDRLYGQSGKDKVAGGTGNDRIDGGTGNDRLSGNSGKDKLAGGTGKDRLAGGSGKDSCNGGPGKDKATCERRRRV